LHWVGERELVLVDRADTLPTPCRASRADKAVAHSEKACSCSMLDVEATGSGDMRGTKSRQQMLVSAFRRGGAAAAHGRGRRLKMSSINFDFDTFCDHAFHGRLADVQRMLELESGKLPVDENLNDAVVRAAEKGHVDIVDYLLRHAMFDPSANDNGAIQVAAQNGRLAVVERLLQDVRVDPSANDNYAVRWAALYGHLIVVERLLQDERVDPAAGDNDAVRMAAQFGHLAVVKRLLQDPRVDPSADDNYAVRWAAHYGRFTVVDRLLEDDRVDAAVAIQYSRPEHLKRFECRQRLTEICIALQDLALPAWVTVQILDVARPWSTLPLHSKWNLVCAVKHFHPEQ
jgi:hypothetical protein